MPPRTLDIVSRERLGSNLVESREAAGLTRGAAANAANTTRTRLSLWERGRETPGAEGLLRLAVAYGCPLDDFFGGVDERYDAIIERRLPPDAKRLYETRKDGLRHIAIKLTEALAAAAPPVVTPAVTRTTTRGKPGPARVHRKPPK